MGSDNNGIRLRHNVLHNYQSTKIPRSPELGGSQSTYYNVCETDTNRPISVTLAFYFFISLPSFTVFCVNDQLKYVQLVQEIREDL